MVWAMNPLEEARFAIEEASAVAVWAVVERDRIRPTLWTWARRRFLDRVFKAKCVEVDRLKTAIEDEERRQRGEPPAPTDPGKPTRWGPGA